MVIIYNFFRILIDKRSSSGIGIARIVTSRMMLTPAWAHAKTWKLMHVPLCSPSQLVQMYDTGVQLKRQVTVNAMP